MSGASPGGVAVLAVVPEHDFAFAAFGNDPRAMALHDQLLLSLLGQHLDVKVPDFAADSSLVSDLTPYAGTYRSNQLRVDVRVVDGQLEESMTYEPLDEVQERIFTRFAGGLSPMPPRRFVSVGTDLFAPAGMPLEAFNGYSRQLLVSYHGNGEGHTSYRCAGGRMTRREPAVERVLRQRIAHAADDMRTEGSPTPLDLIAHPPLAPVARCQWYPVT